MAGCKKNLSHEWLQSGLYRIWIIKVKTFLRLFVVKKNNFFTTNSLRKVFTLILSN